MPKTKGSRQLLPFFKAHLTHPQPFCCFIPNLPILQCLCTHVHARKGLDVEHRMGDLQLSQGFNKRLLLGLCARHHVPAWKSNLLFLAATKACGRACDMKRKSFSTTSHLQNPVELMSLHHTPPYGGEPPSFPVPARTLHHSLTQALRLLQETLLRV